MIHREHRLSKDIDIFIDDPQYLGLLTPRFQAWFGIEEGSYDEAAHYIKLRYPEGEIDFIVSNALSDVPRTTFDFRGRVLPIETPAEIALKKLFHRAEGLKPRDIFDIAVVLSAEIDAKELERQLTILEPVKSALVNRLARLPDPYYQAALAELDIFPPWESVKAKARSMVESLVYSIPSSVL
jgi:Nucleotidyl transferase AbiEii toxin, Type IV TA system